MCRESCPGTRSRSCTRAPPRCGALRAGATPDRLGASVTDYRVRMFQGRGTALRRPAGGRGHERRHGIASVRRAPPGLGSQRPAASDPPRWAISRTQRSAAASRTRTSAAAHGDPGSASNAATSVPDIYGKTNAGWPSAIRQLLARTPASTASHPSRFSNPETARRSLGLSADMGNALRSGAFAGRAKLSKWAAKIVLKTFATSSRKMPLHKLAGRSGACN